VADKAILQPEPDKTLQEDRARLGRIHLAVFVEYIPDNIRGKYETDYPDKKTRVTVPPYPDSDKRAGTRSGPYGGS
jgi:hypothetical protein